jgi:uncharacterized protein (DUF2132 family)
LPAVFSPHVKDEAHPMSEQQVSDPMHGMTLEKIVNSLVELYGWDELGKRIDINCFNLNPSVKSSLKFLRRTPWARTQVEELYLAMKKNER